MNASIYLRPLAPDDARVSYLWRNNPEIWKHSRFVPTNSITIDMETNWLTNSINSTNQRRFAICLATSHTYIGNVQLINISKDDAEFHLFIGETNYWGRGIGSESSKLMLEYAFNELKLQKVTLEVHKENDSAFAIYKKFGFEQKGFSDPYNYMELTSTNFINLQNNIYEKNYNFNTK